MGGIGKTTTNYNNYFYSGRCFTYPSSSIKSNIENELTPSYGKGQKIHNYLVNNENKEQHYSHLKWNLERFNSIDSPIVLPLALI